jgi:hypothetical protein
MNTLKFDPKGIWQQYYEACAQARYRFENGLCYFEDYLASMKNARAALRLKDTNTD